MRVAIFDRTDIFMNITKRNPSEKSQYIQNYGIYIRKIITFRKSRRHKKRKTLLLYIRGVYDI